MRQYDNLDDDNLEDDDSLDSYARAGGAKSGGSSEDQLSAKYADYLMWRDTGSSHDEALDLASMTEEEFTAAEAAEDPDGSGFDRLGVDDEDDLGEADDEDAYGGGSSRSGRRGGDYDDDF